MSAYRDDRLKLDKCFNRIKYHLLGWSEGDVLTPGGIVSVYAEPGLTRLDLARDGTLYVRSFNKRFSFSGAVTKAREFAEEIAGGNV